VVIKLGSWQVWDKCGFSFPFEIYIYIYIYIYMCVCVCVCVCEVVWHHYNMGHIAGGKTIFCCNNMSTKVWRPISCNLLMNLFTTDFWYLVNNFDEIEKEVFFNVWLVFPRKIATLQNKINWGKKGLPSRNIWRSRKLKKRWDSLLVW
jgi:hypothetical protein